MASASVCSSRSNAVPIAGNKPSSSCQHGAGVRGPATTRPTAAGRAAGLSRRAAQAAKPSRRLPGSPRATAEQATAAGAATATDPSSQLPRSPGTMVDQAAAAVQAAVEGGCMRQTLSLLMPINEKEADFNSVEPEDYPCSLQKVCGGGGGWGVGWGVLCALLLSPPCLKTRLPVFTALHPPLVHLSAPARAPACHPLLTACQEFDVACAVTKSLMQRLLGPAAAINAKRIDEGGVEGEPCAGGWSWVGWLDQQQGGMLTRWR